MSHKESRNPAVSKATLEHRYLQQRIRLGEFIPGKTSRINSAPMLEKGQVSEETTQPMAGSVLSEIPKDKVTTHYLTNCHKMDKVTSQTLCFSSWN